jgi:hypothetical protein
LLGRATRSNSFFDHRREQVFDVARATGGERDGVARRAWNIRAGTSIATKTRTAGRRRRARINRALGKLESDERARKRESDDDNSVVVGMRRCVGPSHIEFPRKGRERERERGGGEREGEREREREREREMGKRRRMKRHVGKVAREGRSIAVCS